MALSSPARYLSRRACAAGRPRHQAIFGVKRECAPGYARPSTAVEPHCLYVLGMADPMTSRGKTSPRAQDRVVHPHVVDRERELYRLFVSRDAPSLRVSGLQALPRERTSRSYTMRRGPGQERHHISSIPAPRLVPHLFRGGSLEFYHIITYIDQKIYNYTRG
jgi:hypothetical protein